MKLTEEPFRPDGLGIDLNIPVDATTNSSLAGTTSTATTIIGPNAKYVINIQTPKTGDPKTTVTEVADRTKLKIAQEAPLRDPTARAADPIQRSAVQVIAETKELTIPGSPTPGARFYIAMPKGDSASRTIKGYTIFKTSPTDFLVFELLVAEPDFPTARQAYEMSIATLQFEDKNKLLKERASAATAAVGEVATWTPEVLAAAMPEGEAWFRLYKPAASGSPADAEELGYRKVRFWKGTQAAIPGAIGNNAREGFLAQVSARMLHTEFAGGPRMIVDTELDAFMTPDRQNETWSIRTVLRDGKNNGASHFTETGSRAGTSIEVAVTEPGKATENITPQFPRAGAYICQFETFLVPRLLLRAGHLKAPGEFGFYAYNSLNRRVSLRRDALDRDAAGAWTDAARFHEEAKPQVSTYREGGELMQTKMADGTIWEPIDPVELAKLWKSKNLPMEAPGK